MRPCDHLKPSCPSETHQQMFHPEIINVSQLQKVLHISLGDTWGQLGDSWGTPGKRGGHLGHLGHRCAKTAVGSLGFWVPPSLSPDHLIQLCCSCVRMVFKLILSE